MCCTAWYRMCIRTPYTPGRGVCRVSECRLYSSVYYRMCILTPYTPAYSVAEESAHARLARCHSFLRTFLQARHAGVQMPPAQHHAHELRCRSTDGHVSLSYVDHDSFLLPLPDESPERAELQQQQVDLATNTDTHHRPHDKHRHIPLTTYIPRMRASSALSCCSSSSK